jgi:GNAT superfamily N-acetyltransferase
MSGAPALLFRAAQADDLPAVVALLADDAITAARSGHAVEVTPATRAAFEEIARDPQQLQLVGVLDGAVVACAQLSFIPGLGRGGMRRCLVEAVRVSTELRDRGIGAALMAEVERLARARGCGLLQLTSDQRRSDAHHFYTRLGYVASHVGMKRELG